jgi:hypothetical protein
MKNQRINDSKVILNTSKNTNSKELVIKVKHLIKYLQDNFDEDARVTADYMKKPEYFKDYPVDEIDYLDKLGIFQKDNDELFIQN